MLIRRMALFSFPRSVGAINVVLSMFLFMETQSVDAFVTPGVPTRAINRENLCHGVCRSHKGFLRRTCARSASARAIPIARKGARGTGVVTASADDFLPSTQWHSSNTRPNCDRPQLWAPTVDNRGGRSTRSHRGFSRRTDLQCTAGDGTLQDEDGVEGADRASDDASDDFVLGAQAAQVLEFWQSRQPNPDLPVYEVVGLLMAALQKNDHPSPNDGLRTVFTFSSGMCRRAVGSTAESFISQARASVFGATIRCQSYELDPLQVVGDRLATQVVSVTAEDGRKRRFLWTLERQRRPPDTEKWLIYGVISSDVDGTLTMEG